MAAEAMAAWEHVKVGGAAPGGPGPRSSHGTSAGPAGGARCPACSSCGGPVWVIGGEERAREPAGMGVWRLDLGDLDVAHAAPAWRLCGPKAGEGASPPARNAHAQGLLGTDLWVFGGRTSAEEGSVLDDLWRFDTVAEAWHGPVPVASGAPPPARSYHAACAAGGRFYVFGGCGAEGRLADFHCFDPETRAWRELPAPPSVEGRGGPVLEAFAGGHTLLLFAGFAGRETRDVLTFDVQREEWTRRADLGPGLASRSVCACFPTPDGRIIVYGGEVVPSERGHDGAGGFSGEILEFDAEGNARVLAQNVAGAPRPTPRGWTTMAPLPPVPGATIRGFLYGGLAGDDDAPERLADAWVLSIA